MCKACHAYLYMKKIHEKRKKLKTVVDLLMNLVLNCKINQIYFVPRVHDWLLIGSSLQAREGTIRVSLHQY